MPTPKYSHVCTHACIPKAGKVELKEELKTILKWGKLFFEVILDFDIMLK